MRIEWQFLKKRPMPTYGGCLFAPKKKFPVSITEDMHDQTVVIEYRGERMDLDLHEILESGKQVREMEQEVRLAAQVFVNIVNRSRVINNDHQQHSTSSMPQVRRPHDPRPVPT